MHWLGMPRAFHGRAVCDEINLWQSIAPYACMPTESRPPAAGPAAVGRLRVTHVSQSGLSAAVVTLVAAVLTW